MKDNTELDKISYIDKYINESKEIIKSNNMEAAKRKQKNIIAIFGNNIQGIKVGLTNYDVESMYNRGNINYIEDLKLLIKKLEFYKIEENEGKSLSKNIICNQNIIENNIKIDTEINTEINNTLKEIREISDDIISKKEKEKLIEDISSLKTCKTDKQKSKMKEIVKWLGDKSIDAVIAVLPAIGSIASQLNKF